MGLCVPFPACRVPMEPVFVTECWGHVAAGRCFFGKAGRRAATVLSPMDEHLTTRGDPPGVDTWAPSSAR